MTAELAVAKFLGPKSLRWNLIFDWEIFFSGRQDGSLTNCGTEPMWLLFWSGEGFQKLTLSWQEPGVIVPTFTQNT